MSRCWVGRVQFWEHFSIFGNWEAEGWVVLEQAEWHRAISFSILPSGPTTGMCLPRWQAFVFVGQDIPLLSRQMLKHFYSFFSPPLMLFPPPASQQYYQYFFRWSPWVPNWKLAMLRGNEESCWRANDPISGCHSCVSLDKPLNCSLPQVSPSIKCESIKKQ